MKGKFHHVSSHDGEPPNSRGLDSCDHFIAGLHRKDTLPLKKEALVRSMSWPRGIRVSFLQTWCARISCGSSAKRIFFHFVGGLLRACLLVVWLPFRNLGSRVGVPARVARLVFGNHLDDALGISHVGTRFNFLYQLEIVVRLGAE